MSSPDEVDSSKPQRTSSQSPPGSAGYVRYTKDPCADGTELWPQTQPPPVPKSTVASKADDQQVKTDKYGYLETSIGAASDDQCPGYLDVVEPLPAGDL